MQAMGGRALPADVQQKARAWDDWLAHACCELRGGAREAELKDWEAKGPHGRFVSARPCLLLPTAALLQGVCLQLHTSCCRHDRSWQSGVHCAALHQPSLTLSVLQGCCSAIGEECILMMGLLSWCAPP